MSFLNLLQQNFKFTSIRVKNCTEVECLSNVGVCFGHGQLSECQHKFGQSEWFQLDILDKGTLCYVSCRVFTASRIFCVAMHH